VDWHYAPTENFNTSSYDPGVAGFNVADVYGGNPATAKALADQLPSGVEALVFVGTCNGADGTFMKLVTTFSRLRAECLQHMSRFVGQELE
jgi:hypothetical protein